MTTPVPPIYAANDPQPPLGVGARLVAGLIAAACLTVLVVAARLTPSPTGMETHLQLGLAPCALYRDYGVPCFACGMTTSFAHLAHGHALQSLRAQPAGTVFAFVAAMGVWAGAYVAATGRPGARMLDAVPTLAIFLSLLGIGLLGWAYKVVAVMHY